MNFSDVKRGDKIDYTPRTCVPEHKPLKGIIVRDIIDRGDIFNQPMIVCECEYGWIPLYECEASK